jgi:hypothetical protein
MMTKRSLLLPLMTTFDFSDTTQPCSQRNVSTVAPQALALLNNDFVHQQSGAFAARVIAEAGPDPTAQIDRVWWLALGRAPDDAERQAAVGHLAAQRGHLASRAASDQKALENSEAERMALASLCHVLFNLNEFIYVD